MYVNNAYAYKILITQNIPRIGTKKEQYFLNENILSSINWHDLNKTQHGN